MKIERFFRLSCLILGMALIIQTGLISVSENSGFKQALHHMSASWVRLAKTLPDAIKFSNNIVIASVLKVQTASDIVVPAKGEPNSIDTVPVEAVVMNVEETLFGNLQGQFTLFHTGLSRPDVKPLPIPPNEPEPPKDILPSAPTNLLNALVFLEDDPPYNTGEKYILFLTDGPVLDGVQTKASISPEGRYQITPQGRLIPFTTRGMALQFRSITLSRFRVLLKTALAGI